MTAIQMSESIRELRYSVIREMGQLALGMDDVINLGIGEPDFPTPPPITARALRMRKTAVPITPRPRETRSCFRNWRII